MQVRSEADRGHLVEVTVVVQVGSRIKKMKIKPLLLNKKIFGVAKQALDGIVVSFEID